MRKFDLLMEVYRLASQHDLAHEQMAEKVGHPEWSSMFDASQRNHQRLMRVAKRVLTPQRRALIKDSRHRSNWDKWDKWDTLIKSTYLFDMS